VISLSKQISSTAVGQVHLEQVRLLFEPGIAWQAALNPSDQDINQLKEKLDLNIAAMGVPSEFIRTDVAFHYELTVITKNPLFSAMHDALISWLIHQRAKRFTCRRRIDSQFATIPLFMRQWRLVIR
jgi:DNA-binding FadR family transcriptional regulator